MSDQSKKSKTFLNKKGWKVLKRQYENGFQSNFNMLRPTMHRNELFGSVVELFMSALLGVGKISFTEKKKDDSDIKDQENK